MKIRTIDLKNFRNYDVLKLKFNDKLNIIIGNNAQGKTNILESIYYLSITKSNLLVNDKNIIKKDELFFKILGNIIYDDNTSKKISILFNDKEKKLEIDDNVIKKHSDYIGIFKVIMYSPTDINIVKDGPSVRRKFLNIEISKLDNKYVNLLNEFNILLKQRNEYLKYLKNNEVNKIYFDIMNNKFIDLSIEIYKYRKEFIDKINKYIKDIFKDISGYDNLSIKYITNIDINGDIRNILEDKLNNSLDREILYGSTLYGPHRDDFNLNILDSDLLLYGSQGQQKMAVISLKLALIYVFYDECGEYPVLLLDDLFSELDIIKRNKIIEYLDKDIQTIITTTDLDSIDSKLVSVASIYKVSEGKVTKESDI